MREELGRSAGAQLVLKMGETLDRGVASRQRIEDLERPQLDDRAYRTITLPNKLEVLLIHDAKTDKASAALDVNVGSFGDATDIPGIGHAVEHLLFMGTEKYPKENAYNRYLTSHSGQSNAYTASISTNYYFELAASSSAPTNSKAPSLNATQEKLLISKDESPLWGALIRFSQFFISPLLAEDQFFQSQPSRYSSHLISREDSDAPHDKAKPLKMQQEHEPKSRELQSFEYEIFEIPHCLHVNGEEYIGNALADYCAKFNIVNERYAAKMKLSVDNSKVKEITIGSGKKVRTLGTVQTSFQFSDEPARHNLEFHVLPNCVHNVVLGKTFLKATRTLSSVTNRLRRIQKRIIQGIRRPGLFFLGDSAPTFAGSINGISGNALADSGSSVLVLDEAYAHSLDLEIHKGKEHRTRLELADGSTVYTSGMTKDVRWQFGPNSDAEEHILDFHILKNAPARVILSNSFLYKTEAYSQYECYLSDDEDNDDCDKDAYFFAIGYDPNYQMQPVNMSTIENMAHEERCRRSLADDEIQRLQTHLRDAASARELKKREEWDETFGILRARANEDASGQVNKQERLQSAQNQVPKPPFQQSHHCSPINACAQALRHLLGHQGHAQSQASVPTAGGTVQASRATRARHHLLARFRTGRRCG